MIVFNKQNGLVSFPETPFCNGKISFEFNEISFSSDILKWKGIDSKFISCYMGLEIMVRLVQGMIRIGIRNTGRTSLYLKSICMEFNPLTLGRPPLSDQYQEYIHSFNTASLCGVKKVGLPTRWLDSNPESSMLYMLRHIETGKTMLFSMLPPHRGDFVKFRALHASTHHQGVFGLFIKSTQDRLVRQNSAIWTSIVQVKTDNDPLLMLKQLGDQFAGALDQVLKTIKYGWNSWDYYSGSVSAANVLDNLKSARTRFGDAIKYFVVDEGWQCRWGEWAANRKFPKGMRDLCVSIRAQGGKPGIWTAPIAVDNYTQLYRDHPEWFIKDKHGQIPRELTPYGLMAFLDITRPDVERWVFRVFKRLRRDGFVYFKVDFSQEILRGARWFDQTVSRGDLLRRLFTTIRRAIGDRAYLQVSGAPYESIMGIVDAVRVTGDIHNFWSHVLANASGIAARWWMHGKLWNIDPDFLIVRSKETSSSMCMNRDYTPRPPQATLSGNWLSGREMNLNEVRTYALLVYLSAGDVFLGDDLKALNAAGIKIVKKVIEKPLRNAAIPIDLFGKHDSLPSLWLAKETGSWFLGSFNWDEDIVHIEINLRDLGIPDGVRIKSFWSEKTVETEKGVIAFDLNPHSSHGFRITADC